MFVSLSFLFQIFPFGVVGWGKMEKGLTGGLAVVQWY